MGKWNKDNLSIAMDDSIPIDEKVSLTGATKSAIYTVRSYVNKAGGIEAFLKRPFSQANGTNGSDDEKEKQFVSESGMLDKLEGFIKFNLPVSNQVNFYMNKLYLEMKKNEMLKDPFFFFDPEKMLRSKLMDIIEGNPYPVEKEIVVKTVKVMNDPLAVIYTPKRIILEHLSDFFVTENQINNFIVNNQQNLIGHVLEVSPGRFILDEEGKNRILNLSKEVEKTYPMPGVVTVPNAIPSAETPVVLPRPQDVGEPTEGKVFVWTQPDEEELERRAYEDHTRPKLSVPIGALVGETEVTPVSDRPFIKEIDEDLYEDDLSSRDKSDVKLIYESDPLYFNALLALREENHNNPHKVGVGSYKYHEYCDDPDRHDEPIYRIRCSMFSYTKIYIFFKKCDIINILKRYFEAKKLEWDEEKVFTVLAKNHILNVDYDEKNPNSMVLNWSNFRSTVLGKNGILNSILKYNFFKEG